MAPPSHPLIPALLRKSLLPLAFRPQTQERRVSLPETPGNSLTPFPPAALPCFCGSQALVFSVAELQVEDKPCDQETSKLSLCGTRPIWADGDNNQQALIEDQIGWPECIFLWKALPWTWGLCWSELRCWRRLMRVPWTARRSTQSILN